MRIKITERWNKKINDNTKEGAERQRREKQKWLNGRWKKIITKNRKIRKKYIRKIIKNQNNTKTSDSTNKWKKKKQNKMGKIKGKEIKQKVKQNTRGKLTNKRQ